MIITIDGPAGTGKSSVAQTVAERLGFDFLDTGAMYRAIGLACLRHHADLNNAREIAFFARHARVEFDWSKRPPGVLLNNEPVGHLLRGSEATRAASFVAQVPAIREQLVGEQQRIGRQRPDLVTEGRDQGTVVFPDARLKFYLDATPQERAKRRIVQLRARGEVVDFQDVVNEIIARDTRDATRSVGPLAVPPDARVIDTTRLTLQEVADAIVAVSTQVMAKKGPFDGFDGFDWLTAGRLSAGRVRAGCDGSGHRRPMSREPRTEEHFAPPRPNPPWKAAQTLCRVSFTLCFDLKVYGVHHVPRTGGVLLLSNHQSYLDPVLVGVRLRRPLSYMARSGLFEVNPIFTWIIRKLAAFPVRQEGSAAGAVKFAINRLKDGHALNIFPEGSRTETGEIGPIEGGSALVVRGAKGPVVPVVIDGSFEAWPNDYKMPLPHPIQVQYGPPADLTGQRPAEIVKWADRTLREMYDELLTPAGWGEVVSGKSLGFTPEDGLYVYTTRRFSSCQVTTRLGGDN